MAAGEAVARRLVVAGLRVAQARRPVPAVVEAVVARQLVLAGLRVAVAAQAAVEAGVAVVAARRRTRWRRASR